MPANTIEEARRHSGGALSGVKLATAAVLMPLLLAACQTGPCTGDPRTDSLHCAASGLNSGSYARDTARLQAQASSRLELAAAESRRAQSAQRQAAAAGERRAGASAAVRAQDAEIAALRNQLAEREAALRQARSGPVTQAEVSRLEADVRRLRSQIARLTRG